MKSKEIFSTVFAKAGDLANEMTEYNTRLKRLVAKKKMIRNSLIIIALFARCCMSAKLKDRIGCKEKILTEVKK